VAFVTGVLICMTGNCVRSMVQNATRPRARGMAFSIFNLSDDVGRGLGDHACVHWCSIPGCPPQALFSGNSLAGPLAVAMLISSWGGKRRPAFNVAALFWCARSVPSRV